MGNSLKDTPETVLQTYRNIEINLNEKNTLPPWILLIAGKEAEWKGKVGEEIAGPGSLRKSLKLPGRIMRENHKFRSVLTANIVQV